MAKITSVVMLVLLLIWASCGNAQDTDRRWVVGGRAGINLWFTDYKDGVAGDGWELMLRYGVARWFSFGLQLGYEELKASNKPNIPGLAADYMKLHSFPASFVGTLHLLPGRRIAPFLYFGVGGMAYQRKDGLGNFVGGSSIKVSYHIPVGIGVETFLFSDVSFVVDGGYRLLEDRTDFFQNGGKDSYLTGKAGLNWYFGKKRHCKEIDDDSDDPDKDGLNMDQEGNQKTDPCNPDTDGDGLSDGEEVMKYKTDPLNADTDGDGLKDGEEVTGATVELRVVGKPNSTRLSKTDPLNPDTDGDGLSDGDEEMRYKTDPLNVDTDGDGLKDGEEVSGTTVELRVVGKPGSTKLCKTDPLNPDTDGDGLNDGDEVTGAAVKLKVVNVSDVSDSTNMSESTKLCKTDPSNPDTDGDGLKDGEEIIGATVELKVVGDSPRTKLCQTDPLNPDTDSDNLKDGQEVNGSTVELKVVGRPDSTKLKLCKTDPLNPDTDGEGCLDGEEVTGNTDPLDKRSWLDCRGIVGGRLKLSTVAPFKSGRGGKRDIPKTEDLANVVVILKQDTTILVDIIGHADSRGPKRINDALSVKRAEAVKTWLEDHGIETKRMRTKGKGSTKPDESYKTWHAKQRRVEIWKRE